jgi:hypothetical protein
MLNVSSNKQKEKMVLQTKDSKLDYVQAKKRDYRKANRKAKTVLSSSSNSQQGNRMKLNSNHTDRQAPSGGLPILI